MDAVPPDALRERPDVPIDIFASINGIAKFHTSIRDPEGASFWLDLGSKLRYLETNTRGISEQA
ncbi:hypothetical protein EC912_104152 [Luteibacter rhizovicinus]|uniref:Uncharacterized protein n=2 Tax=Luteibacter rhizovicinus TaxID=242606 RepID=A0A4R3YNP7_9GAMM|nr:hypothetical protein EC912_104152 [Luteibacter rhizovicinus]